MSDENTPELVMADIATYYVVIDGYVYEQQPNPLPDGWKTVAFVPKSEFQVGTTVPEEKLPYYTMCLDGGGWVATYNASKYPDSSRNKDEQLYATPELCDTFTKNFYKSGYELIHNITHEVISSRY